MSRQTAKRVHEWIRERVCDYTELFLNRWNEECACCWAGFIAACHLGAGLVIGAVIW